MTEPAISLENETETMTLGARLAPLLQQGDVICLSGNLGAGKSTLARGLIKALKQEEEAPSPTFTFVETYEMDAFVLRHFDLYRLEQPEDVWELGFEEALEDGVLLIEWPERIEQHLPADALWIQLDIADNKRTARFSGAANWSKRLEQAGIASW